MNTNALKRFATESRKLLMKGVKSRLEQIGFKPDGSVTAEPIMSGNVTIMYGNIVGGTEFYDRWQELHRQIERHGVKEVVEQAAYTWFNRFMAIRILDRNNLAPDILQYENHEVRLPKIVTDARAGKTPVLNEAQRTALNEVIFDGSKTYEQFSVLIQAYCENNALLRSCFSGITDYTMLLLPPDILGEGNFIDLLNETSSLIDRDDYRKPELIGWLYQFYISDKKDEVFAKKGGYKSDEIPAATQIFTPNWIVKYMVENTLGRIYLDNNPGSQLAENWKYLVNPTEPTPADAVLHYTSLEQLTCADLSCGSGHILNEMFDLLYQLYEEDFYSPREAIEAIFRKNMVGIDIDVRAQQLATFALLLNACQRDSAFTDGHCLPRIYSFPDVNEEYWRVMYSNLLMDYSLETPSQKVFDELCNAFKLLENADVLGSIIKFDISPETKEYIHRIISTYLCSPTQPVEDAYAVPTEDLTKTRAYWIEEEQPNERFSLTFKPLINALEIILALTEDYVALCMNPPYMPTGKEPVLSKYAKANYPDSKADLFAVFMDVAYDRLKEKGKYGMLNMQSWMFLSSFESLRKDIIDNQQIDSLLHLGPRTFDELSGEVVQNVAFVISKEKPLFDGVYNRLVNGKNCNAKRELFLEGKEKYIVNQKQYEQIPGSPIAFWVSETIIKDFGYEKLEKYGKTTKGLVTGENDLFLRLWAEVDFLKIKFNCKSEIESRECGYKWFPCNKGGSFRKWYGNNEYIVNWKNGGEDIFRNAKIKGCHPQDYYNEIKFQCIIVWSSITSYLPSFRFKKNCLVDNAGKAYYPYEERKLNYILAFLNSKIARYILSFFCPTVNINTWDINRLPIIFEDIDCVNSLIRQNISISKQDWDAHETSWDFETNPLIAVDEKTYFDNIDWAIEKHRRATGEEIAIDPEAPQFNSLEWRYKQFCQKWECLFNTLHQNEEEINRFFIEIYGLQDELNPHVEYEDITILQNGEISLYRPTHAMDMYKFIKEEKQNFIKAGGLIEGDMVIAFQSLITWNKDVIIKQLISYAVGCMMGRYRLDRPGLAIAHTNPSAEEIAEYIVPQTGKAWWIDDDGIVPMMDDDCGFHDNASNRFSEFIEAVFGTESKTENLNFIREALGKDIVDYFRNNFYADHKKMYQNRPIYWMFSSNQKGKRAAFQCLVYMHRMNRFTPEHIRTNYLLPYIETLAAREADLSSRTSLTARENKQLKQIKADLEECREYQLRLHDFADQQIEIDLDDGVVKNYATFAPVLAKLK